MVSDPANEFNLRRLPFLHGINDDTLAKLKSLSWTETKNKDDVIVEEGIEDGKMSMIVGGHCDVYKRVEATNEDVRVHKLHVGGFIGLGSMFDKEPHSATVKAGEDNTVVVFIKHSDFLANMTTDVSLSILHFMSKEMKLGRSEMAVLQSDKQGVMDDSTRILFYSTQDYEKRAFEEEMKKRDSDIKIHIDYLETQLNENTVTAARGYDVVCIFVNDICNSDVVHGLQSVGVKMIALRCAGFNNVDLALATTLGITVARVPAYSPYAVAEHAATLAMTLNRKMHLAVERVKNGNFSLNGLVGFDMHGRTVGVVGTGKIGQCFMAICQGLGMEILCYDKYPNDKVKEYATYVELDDLLKRSDIVSLHLPLFKDTYHLINDESLKMMKENAILVNTSRGALVNAKALINALKRKGIGGAALDVYEEEAEYFFKDMSRATTIQDDVLARLLTFNNVIITSHQAFLTTDALGAIASTTIGNVSSFASGNTLTKCENTLNK
eukprot:Clim_evm61s153 gene=Clim_evmTU61s153